MRAYPLQVVLGNGEIDYSGTTFCGRLWLRQPEIKEKYR